MLGTGGRDMQSAQTRWCICSQYFLGSNSTITISRNLHAHSQDNHAVGTSLPMVDRIWSTRYHWGMWSSGLAKYTPRCLHCVCGTQTGVGDLLNTSTWTVKVTLVNPQHISDCKFYTRPDAIVPAGTNLSFWVGSPSFQDEVPKWSFNIRKDSQSEEIIWMTLPFTFLWGKHAIFWHCDLLSCKLFRWMISKCQIHDSIMSFVVDLSKSRRFICWLEHDESCSTMLVCVAINAFNPLLRLQTSRKHH